ncbi:MAG: ribonuclease HII [Desulfobulbaceae bacterium]|nr:ribonuclease HII [Desulfobulbaceae bacterium]
MPIQQSLGPGFVESDSFAYERRLIEKGMTVVAGVDEAGRGPLAGPVVAACVILPGECDFTIFKDSKKLSAAARQRLRLELDRIGAQVGVGVVSPADIDRLNILQASLFAMRQAMEALPVRPDFLLVDGKFPVPVAVAQQPLVRGESRSASIAAASIVAKVTRDQLMEGYHEQFPSYNFRKHKGYPTAEHRQAIRACGPCPIHRLSFRGVREFVGAAG